MLLVIVLLSFLLGVAVFVRTTTAAYRGDRGFTALPLRFDPDTSSSEYRAPDRDVLVTVRGGFVKGLMENDGGRDIVVRALSPLPGLRVEGGDIGGLSLILENVAPDFYAKRAAGGALLMTKEAVNRVRITVPQGAGGVAELAPSDDEREFPFVILGDNRDGYETFAEIVQQVNGEAPAFIIANGDFVYSGRPNQYRLFDEALSRFSATVCTVPGNHDIRNDGRGIYTMLYGPSHYSFDLGGCHFVFLDSSPGWLEERAISEEQYQWLERDLGRARGKRIFVTTHIPPEDPRHGPASADIPNYTSEAWRRERWTEEKLNDYMESRLLNHGFRDPKEAERFEQLMSAYHVDTVYTSHIHSYLEYTRGNVKYMVTGGAGAELLSRDSYHHYVVVRLGSPDMVRVVELPSPLNTYLARFAATAGLFATAIYRENRTAVLLLGVAASLLVVVLLVKLYLKGKGPIDTFARWALDTGRYGVRHFRELFGKGK